MTLSVGMSVEIKQIVCSDKKELVRVLLIDKNTEFHEAFKLWFERVREYLVDEERGAPTSCWEFDTTKSLPKSKNKALYITGLALTKKDAQIKLVEWLKKYLPSVSLDYKKGKNNKDKKDTRMPLGQFIICGCRPIHVRHRFFSEGWDEETWTNGGWEGYDCSHLCRNPECYRHIVADPYWVNRFAREACPGPEQCTCWQLDCRRISKRRICKTSAPKNVTWNKKQKTDQHHEELSDNND
jgi:hypothetical protein